MTVTCLVSIKGAPGVTTLACLVGATWPDGRRVAVIEADPFGGDLAARFQLSNAWGWSSYVTASRRSEGRVPLDAHLQTLPGGLEVLVLPERGHRGGIGASVESLVRSCGSADHGLWDLVVDGGRLMATGIDVGPIGDPHSIAGPWLDRSDVVIIVTRRDPASILRVRHHGRALRERCGDRMRLVLVGQGPHDTAAIEKFTGFSVIAEVPFDVASAQVATGEGGSSRHLSRSLLVVSARRLALVLAGEKGGDGDREPGTAAVGGRRTPWRSIHLLRRTVQWTRLRRTVRGEVGDSIPMASSLAQSETHSGPLAAPDSASPPAPAPAPALTSAESEPASAGRRNGAASDGSRQDVLS
jgi:hypothetical protein